MVEHVQLAVGEAYRINTEGNSVTIIVPAAGQKWEIRDTNNNVIVALSQPHEFFTLPLNTGEYLLVNTGTVTQYCYLARFYVY